MSIFPVDAMALLLMMGRAVMGLRNGAPRQLLALAGGALGELLGCMVVWGVLYQWVYGHADIAARVAWLGGDQGVVVALLTAVVVMGVNTLLLRSPQVAQHFEGRPVSGISRGVGGLLGMACAVRQLFFAVLLMGTISLSGQPWWQHAMLRSWLQPGADYLAAHLGMDRMAAGAAHDE